MAKERNTHKKAMKSKNKESNYFVLVSQPESRHSLKFWKNRSVWWNNQHLEEKGEPVRLKLRKAQHAQISSSNNKTETDIGIESAFTEPSDINIVIEIPVGKKIENTENERVLHNEISEME